MKRLLLLVIILIFCQLFCLGEEFLPEGRGFPLTKETNPIYFGYMEDYAAQLKAALDKSHMLRLRGMGADYDFIIHRDGTITDMRVSISQGKYFDRKIKEIILSVKPLPFRDGMNMDEMQFSVYLGFEKYEDVHESIGSSFKNNKKVFLITVITKK